jgi:hypothetical protein
MLVNKKRTNRDYLTRRNFFNSSIVNPPLTEIPLIGLLVRIGTTLCPIIGHIAFPAWPIAWWDIGTTLPRIILGKSNSITLANTSLGLILLLRRAIPDVCSRWTILSLSHYMSFRLRSTYLISPLTTLGCSIYRVVLLS